MSYKKLYMQWLEKAKGDPELLEELLRIQTDDDAIEDRFYRELAFGTGGMRGLIGAGTNRMNVYTVARASQGLANYLKGKKEAPSIAIAYDSRKNSYEFALTAASVFAANGIKVHIFGELTPTPMLSFAVRELGCDAGIVVTASHNPAAYNGYKVYNEDGCQITLEAANQITAYIGELDYFSGIKTEELERAKKRGMFQYIETAVEDAYFAAVKACSVYADVKNTNLKVVYTPLNGAGNKPVRRILEAIGIYDLYVVPEQELPDVAFSTCPYPNPESQKALSYGIELAERIGADIVLGTDPDCDRVGAAVLYGGEYTLINGNQMGALLLNFICRMRKKYKTIPDRPFAVKTIVTTELVQAIADSYGVELKNVLTGFKFIGECIGDLEKEGEENRFVFGLEESYGYLSGTYVRDKDAVNASMLVCEMAAYYKKKGKTLVDALFGLYEKFGVYYDRLESTSYEGAQGMRDMADIMDKLRESPPSTLASEAVVEVRDYLKRVIYKQDGQHDTGLPASNVLGLALESGSTVIVRPSGTEPKLKVYYSLHCDGGLEECEKRYQTVVEDMAKILRP